VVFSGDRWTNGYEKGDWTLTDIHERRGTLILLASFALLAGCVAQGWTVGIDRATTTAAIANRTPLLSEVAVNVTALGSAPVVVLIAVLAAAYGLVVRRPRLALALLCTPLAFVVNEAMKLLMRQARPMEAIITLPPSYGFPSGHSVAASALFLTLALVAAQSPNPGVRRLLVGAAIGIALLVAWSRVYLGVHYLTDVTGGLLLGTAGALAASRLATVSALAV
jgi:undecaprenyl-diphosphatase